MNGQVRNGGGGAAGAAAPSCGRGRGSAGAAAAHRWPPPHRGTANRASVSAAQGAGELPGGRFNPLDHADLAWPAPPWPRLSPRPGQVNALLEGVTLSRKSSSARRIPAGHTLPHKEPLKENGWEYREAEARP